MASEAIDDAISHLDALIASLENGSLTQDPPRAPSSASPLESATPEVMDAPVVAPASDALMGNASACFREPAASDAKSDAHIIKQAPEANVQEVISAVDQAKPNVVDAAKKKPLKTPGGAVAKPPVDAASENAGNFDKAHLQVGLIHSVDNHPVSEKLYCCKVEVANGEIRKVVAGLKKFIPSSELIGKKVSVILNLKPAKLAGEPSEAMILAGDARSDGDEIVKVLEPPAEASVGDRIYIEHCVPSASPSKQLSSKIWEKIVHLLKVEAGVARFDGKALVTSSGVVTVPGVPDGAGIH